MIKASLMVPILLISLSGCAPLERASVSALDAAFDYICKGARVGPLSKKLRTQADRIAYIQLCSDVSTMVPMPAKPVERQS